MALAMMAGCQAPTPPAEPASAVPAPVTADTSQRPARSTDAPAPEETVAAAAAPAPAAFVGKVWKVEDSSSVEKGTTYTFLSDGTLVVDSPNGEPMYGRWIFDKGALSMIEEGITYPTEILALNMAQFRILSHNPGEPVEILLVPAPELPLPPAQAPQSK